MVVYTGWVVVREAYSENGEDENLLKETIASINNRIRELEAANEFYDMRSLNGRYHLTIKADHNHRSENIIEFFKWVAKISVGSFGLLYIWDDEDKRENSDNRFKVWRMAKGSVDELEDTFLSPCNPRIEE